VKHRVVQKEIACKFKDRNEQYENNDSTYTFSNLRIIFSFKCATNSHQTRSWQYFLCSTHIVIVFGLVFLDMHAHAAQLQIQTTAFSNQAQPKWSLKKFLS
jgi:hypothetical protein